MSVEIKNLVINVRVAGASAEEKALQVEELRSEIIEECREYINECIEKSRER
jgi:hypothetical protein